MECRKLEITVVSAQNLPDVRHFGVMKVYAVVSLKGAANSTKISPVDYQGELNPTWNFVADYTIVGESTVRSPGVNLVVRLLCRRTLGRDKFVGRVEIPLKNLFDMGLKSQRILTYTVAGTPKGRLNLLYSFSERMLVRKKTSESGSGIGTVGFLVLVGGAMLLLAVAGSGQVVDVDDDEKPRGCRDICVEEYDGDEAKPSLQGSTSRDVCVEEYESDVFYDAV